MTAPVVFGVGPARAALLRDLRIHRKDWPAGTILWLDRSDLVLWRMRTPMAPQVLVWAEGSSPDDAEWVSTADLEPLP